MNPENDNHMDARILPANRILASIGNLPSKVSIVGWRNHKIYIRYYLPADEYIDLVHRVIDDCTTEDGHVAVELLDFSVRINVVGAYALVGLPDSFEELYEVAYNSGLYELVCENANHAQIVAIADAIDKYIK